MRVWFWLISRLMPVWAAKQAFSLFITPQRPKWKEPLPLFAKAWELEQDNEGDKCKGWRWNMGGSPRILILHGFSSYSRNFSHLVEALIKKGADVVAFDAPAHGSSEGKRIHSLRYRKFIQTLRNEWGPFDGYLSHSFGGLSLSLALEEQAPRPEERVVLVAPATETRSALRQLQSNLGLSESIMDRIRQMIESKGGHPVSWFSVNRVVKELPNPILWIHDRKDEVTPYEDTLPSQSLKRSNLHFRTTEGLGHRQIYRDPAVCEEIVEFLTASKPG